MQAAAKVLSCGATVILLMIEILHYLKDPKLYGN